MWQRSAGPLRRLRAVLEVDLHRHVRSPFGCQLAVGFLHVRLLAEASMPSLRHERPRPVSALLRRARPRACRKSIDFQTITRCDGLRVFRGGQVGDSVIVREASGDTGQHAGRRWDVALSFACPQRDYVRAGRPGAEGAGGRCFYDAAEQTELWGEHLAEELPRIYARESVVVVVFLSADYAGRDWTRLERRAAFSRAVAEAGGLRSARPV